jgi:CheY-like chemotaxis protein
MTQSDNRHELRILLVEDNPADVMFLQEAIEANGTPAQVDVVDDGLQAMDFLRRQGPYAGVHRPNVVVLDLNLPIKTGQEVLKEMASDISLQTIPVAILTTSSAEASICDIYPPGRCLYFVKTGDFESLMQIARQIAAFAGTV